MRKFLEIFLKILLIFGVLFPSFSFAQDQPLSPTKWGEAGDETKSQRPISLPETLEELKTIGQKALRLFPQVLREVWQEALGIWQKWFGKLTTRMLVFTKNVWQKILSFFGKEIEKRKPIIEEEFKKEKEEMKEEIPKVWKTLWERFRELIKK